MKRKKYRVYYHRQGDYPIAWCIDEGSIKSQFWVRDVVLETKFIGKHILTPKGKKKVAPNEPTAWFEGTAILSVIGGVAYFIY